jgi:hypothetical protein
MALISKVESVFYLLLRVRLVLRLRPPCIALLPAAPAAWAAALFAAAAAAAAFWAVLFAFFAAAAAAFTADALPEAAALFAAAAAAAAAFAFALALAIAALALALLAAARFFACCKVFALGYASAKAC